MANVFVVFGSKSDEKTYAPLLEKLKSAGLSCEFNILSAHKTPKQLKQAVSNTNAPIFVCGAGLSAALPGVVAAEQLKPVIGIPCEGAFEGLDAFLSIAQMPPDVPVIGVGVGRVDEVAKLCSIFSHGFSEIILLQKKSGIEKKYFDKCRAFMQENEIPFIVAPREGKNSVNVYINFCALGKKAPLSQNTTITVLVSENASKKDALKFFDSLQGCYYVALNSYKNAAIAALQLVNHDSRFDPKIVELRNRAVSKTLDSNK